MKRSIITVLGLILIAGTAYSQLKVNIGVSTAINSTIVLDKGFNADPAFTRVQSFEMAPFGFTFGTHFSNKFALSLEGILTNYKSVYNIKEKVDELGKTADEIKNLYDNAPNIADLNFDMQYLHLPVLLKFMGGGDGKARMNFQFGPQLSFLTSGSETLDLDALAANKALVIPDIPEGANINDYIPGATSNLDGTFTMPSSLPSSPVDLLSKNGEDIAGAAEEKLAAFKNQEFHLMGGLGVDLDVSKNIYISMNIKADYSFTDMRNGDLINQLKTGTLAEVFGNRANLAIGAQITLNYMFGGTRSFLAAAGL